MTDAAGMLGDAQVVRGDIGRKLNNALTLSFAVGEDSTIATAEQGGGDGRGKKLGTLFGFKNGGPGRHLITATSGATLMVESREQQPTLFTVAGAPCGTADRGATSVVRDADGATVFTVAAHPDGATTVDAFRMLLFDASGAPLGSLDVVRSLAGWTLGTELVEQAIWFGRAGQPLKAQVLGTMLSFGRPPTALEGDLALGVCVDCAIGLRPYITEMQ